MANVKQLRDDGVDLLDQAHGELERGREQREQRDAELKADLTNVMSTLSGRRLITQLLMPMYGTSPLEPYAAARAAGKRDVALGLHDLLVAHCPDLYLQLTRERLNG